MLPTIFGLRGTFMIYKEIKIEAQGSLDYAKLELFLLDTPADKIKIKKRPMMIICPGGAYCKTSYREGEPLAMHFLSQGYHACVLRYSVAPAEFPTQVLEVGQVMKIIHEHAEEWQVDTDNIFLQGASAGGHLAASFGIYWDQDFVAVKTGVNKECLKLKGILLSYPVITTDVRYGHLESFENLLGDRFEKCAYQMSLENQVRSSMPPVFMWHTAEDATVPVENSLLFAMALRRVNVPVELHIFPKGEHGLSLANPLVEREDGSGVQPEAAQWIYLADRWIHALCKEVKY